MFLLNTVHHKFFGIQGGEERTLILLWLFMFAIFVKPIGFI